jgi:hypothetical protein
MVEIDERRCPNCNHGVLNWDTACPGCDQVPWDTPAGHRVIRQRRRRQWLLANGPIAGLLILIGAFWLVGNFNLNRVADVSGQAAEMSKLLDDLAPLEMRLEQAKSLGEIETQAAQAAVQNWYDQHVPDILNLIGDARQSEMTRMGTLVVLSQLFSPRRPFRELVPGHLQHAVQFLQHLAETETESAQLRTMAQSLLVKWKMENLSALQ